MTRLEKIYREKVVPVLQKEFNYSSSMQLPGIEKISLNIGLGAASQNNKLMEEAVAELTAIAGQKAVVTRAKKSIASFKLREGGCLADIAPTLIELMGMEQPKEMTGKSLLVK